MHSTYNTFAIEVFVSDGFFIVQAPTRTALFERLEKLYGKYLLHYFKINFTAYLSSMQRMDTSHTL